jgi:hypothetical protein
MSEHIPQPSKGFWSAIATVIVSVLPWLNRKKKKEPPNMYPFY